MSMDTTHPKDQPFEPHLLNGADVPASHQRETYEDHLDGYEAARDVIHGSKDREDVTEAVKASGLKGRGGAGFPTGVKWGFIPDTDGKRYLVCNADESEPGCFKDRVLMEEKPHQLIEGMIISAYALNVDEAYIYIRGEYQTAHDRLDEAIEEAYEAGYLGENMFESDESLDLYLVRGAGAYIVGEETALLNSLEGKRGVPRKKPPFPAVEGLFGKPTVINNAETLSTVTQVLKHGPDWYQQWGTEDDPGFRLLSISGDVRQPGVYEIPLGTPIPEILEEYAGGVAQDRELKGIIPGGSSTPPVRGDNIDVDWDDESMQEVDSRTGAAGMIVFDETLCVPKLAHRLSNFYAHESCGWCSPCREGVPWLTDLLREVEQGVAPESDLDKIERVADHIEPNCFCPLGPSAAIPVKHLMDYWGEEFEHHVKNGECDMVSGGQKSA
jgi:NADH-quinone oxidoreductase subunit F